jgi:uncharacterized protein (TIGR03545 family)
LRKSGIIFLAVVAVIAAGIHFLLTDRLVEKRLETAASRLNGALVELDGFDLALLDLRVRWTRLQVADPDDPMKNLFESGPADFNVDLAPLFRKKIIIENVRMQNMRAGTDRERDGSLPESLRREKSPFMRKMEERFEDTASRIPVFNPDLLTKDVDIEGVWSSLTLESPAKIRALHGELNETLDQWEQRLSNLPSRDTVDELEDRIASIKPREVDTVEELARSLERADEAYGDLSNHLENAESMLSRFDEDTRGISRIDERISWWIEEDYRSALALAQLPDLSKESIAEMLFGDSIVSRVEKITGIVGKVRRYTGTFRTVVPKKEKTPRLRGQDIPFVREQTLPKLWIKAVALSGAVRSIDASGTVTDVASSQRTTGLPARIDLSGARPDRAALNLSGFVDHREEVPVEEFSLGLVELPMKDMSLTDFPLLPGTVTGGRADLVSSIRFTGGDMEARVRFIGREVTFAPPERTEGMSDLMYETARSLAGEIDRIDMQATVRLVDDRLTLDMTSNLDGLVADRLEDLATEELEKARREIEGRIHAEVDPLAREVEESLTRREQDMRTRLEDTRSALTAQSRVLREKRRRLEEKLVSRKERTRREVEKELGDRLDADTGEVEEKLQDSIKKLF